MQPLQPDDPPVVGRYRLVGRLGEGGMGRVYAGRTPEGQPAAVKVVRPELAGDPGFRARFRREVGAAAAVAGMFTARVLDADPDADPPWLATQYVDGPSLREVVLARGPLDEPSLLRLAHGLAEALAAIHAAGLVHRDLKPANVLLAADGARVIDFGIARATGATQLTGTGAVLGTPGYMAPEQIDGRTEPGPASDVFAMGATLCFAGTGRGPFPGADGAALLYRILQDEPDLRGLPPAVADLARACLAKDPARRPTAPRLAAWLRGDAVPEGAVPQGAVPAPPRRRTALVATLVAAALLLGAGTAAAVAAATGALGPAAPRPAPSTGAPPDPVAYDPAGPQARYVDRLCRTGALLVSLSGTTTQPAPSDDPAVLRTEFLTSVGRTIGVVDSALPDYRVLRDDAPTPELATVFGQVVIEFEAARTEFVAAEQTVEASDPLTVDAYGTGVDRFGEGARHLAFAASLVEDLELPEEYAAQGRVSPACAD